MPQLAGQTEGLRFVHFVQTRAEADKIRATGQEVVSCLEEVVRDAVRSANPPKWQEPDDFRDVVGYDWSPIYADRHLPEFDAEVRDRVAGALQQELERIFAKVRPDGFLSEPVALMPTHYCLYLCKKNGVRPLLWAGTFWPDHFYFVDQSDISVPVRRKPLAEVSAESRQAIQSYVDRVVADEAGPAYHHKFALTKQRPMDYFKQRAGTESLIYSEHWQAKLIQAARTGRSYVASKAFPAKFDYITAASANEQMFYLKNLFGSRSRYNAPPQELSDDNIFFPLQFEPEASLLYSAPDFRDQYALIEQLACALPHGKVLWLKEHPNQFGVLAQKRWQDLRRRYANLRLVYGRENGRELIKKCGLSVVITSQAGIESLLLGRRAIVFGSVFYRDFPGTIPVTSMSQAVTALGDAGNYGQIDVKDQIVASLDHMARNSYPGRPHPSATLFSDENLGKVARAIEAELGVTGESGASG